MFLIRLVEEKILESFKKGLLSGTTHTSIGQEACAVGVINTLELNKDIIFSNHRGHGHFLVYSEDIVGLFGEIMGKEIGVCEGIGGSQHLYKNNFYTNGIQGGIVPCATGIAFAEKMKKTRSIVVVFLGDGTLGQGVVYESLNIASLWSLPILFVIENNQYAQSTPIYLQHAGKLIDRAMPFGIERNELNVESVINVYESAKKAVLYVRNQCNPFFLLLNTYRFAAHSKGDDFRDIKEIEKYKEKDPLKNLRKEIDTKLIIEIEKEVQEKVNNAFDAAMKAPKKSISQFLRK
jgi:TPP-dependent pyruvate/acetoin dehydrogenase alpha subunit